MGDMAQTVTVLEVADVQAMIDEATAPLEARIAALEADEDGGGSGRTITTDIPEGWRQVIHEDFDLACSKEQFDAVYGPRRITRYPANYADTRQQQGRGGGYYSAPIWVEDSVLRCQMWVENGVAKCMSLVPRATDVGKWGDSPGLIWEECSRFTFSDGFKAAHLSWPQSNDSTPDGEIDYPEFDCDDPVSAFCHHQGATSGSDQKQFTTSIAPDEWHVYRTVWKMGQYLEFSCDGELIAPRYTTRIPSTPMHLSLQNETWLRDASVPPDAEGLIETDWIRVFVPL